MAARFDRDRIRELLALASVRLTGEWLLIGGAAAAMWFSPGRTTEDLDLIGLSGTQAERFALMELAVEAALPVEAVNSTADFFVRRIPDWRDQLVELFRGPALTIFRPSATLFLLLKLGRLSETDLGDCLGLLAYEPVSRDTRERVIAAIANLPPTTDEALATRRSALLAAISGPP